MAKSITHKSSTHFLTNHDYINPKPDAELVRKSIVYKLIFILGIDPKDATPADWLNAAMFAARDLTTENFLTTRQAHEKFKKRTVYYLSMEFLMGRAFTNSLINQDLYEPFKQALAELGLDIGEVSEHENDPAWGNGGLGRLAACFLDSLASMSVPAVGYGLRYRYGMFKQEIVDGQQVEKPDVWLGNGMS